MIKTFGLTHIALAVKSAKRAFEFYQQVFGVEKVYDKGSFIQAQTPGTRDVLVFEAQSHDDIREMVNFWRDTTDFEVHPAIDLAANFRQQGMKVA